MARKTNRALVTTEEERNKILEENKELVEDFLNYLETTDHAPKSINVYKSNLNIFFVWLMKFAKNKDFVDIKKRDIMNFQNYLIKQGLSPSKVDYYLNLWLDERKRLGVTIDDLFIVKRENTYRAATSDTVSCWMKICGEILNKDCYVHSFRHFFVSSLRRANIPLDIIKDIVGHASSEVTAIYDDNPREDGFLKYFSDDGIVHIKETSLSDI